jgi:hypothetical protein
MSATARVELTWPEQNMVMVGDDQYFAVVRDGVVHLIASRCPHRGGPLHLGDMEAGRLRCPWHGNSFRVQRLCVRGIATIQRDDKVIAYVPAKDDSEPVVSHAMVLAQ